jgi:hypothetical protein
MTTTESGTYNGGEVAFSTASSNYLVGAADDGIYPLTQLVSSSGAITGSSVPMTAETANFTRPSVTYNSVRDEFLVSWARQRRGIDCTDDVGCGVWVQRVDASDGSLVSEATRVYETDDSANPTFGTKVVAAPGLDEYLVTWQQGGWWFPGNRLFARRMNGDGTPIDTEPQLVSGEMTYAQRPSVTYSAEACAYQITWQGWNGPSENEPDAHIYGRQYEAPCQSPSGKPNLKVSVSSASKVKAGKSFGASVKVTNRPPAPTARSTRSAPAEQVKTCVKLPKGTSVAKAKGAKVNGRTVCWTRSSLAIGSSVTYKLSLKAFRTTSGKKTLRATVTADNAEGQSVTSSGRAAIRILRAPKPRPKPPTG